MSNIDLTVQACSKPGLAEVDFGDALSTGDVVRTPNEGKKTCLVIRYTGVGTITISIKLFKTVDGQLPAAKTLTLTGAAGELVCIIPPLEADIYNNTSSKSEVTISWTGGTPVVDVAAVMFN